MYALVEKSAQMPSSCWGRYRKLAIVEVAPYDPVFDPLRHTPQYGDPIAMGQCISMISPRARGVVRVLRVADRLHHTAATRRTKIMFLGLIDAATRARSNDPQIDPAAIIGAGGSA